MNQNGEEPIKDVIEAGLDSGALWVLFSVCTRAVLTLVDSQAKCQDGKASETTATPSSFGGNFVADTSSY